MRFKVRTDEMNAGMGMVTRALSPHPRNPAWDGVLIESEEGALMLTCTDGDVSVKARVDATVIEPGCALLPAKLLADIMRRQFSGEVDIKVDEKFRAVITILGAHTTLTGMPPEDFPDIEDVAGDRRVVLPYESFRDAVARVAFAIANDENRKILTGILIECYREETLLVGLDGFRLALRRIVTHNDLPEGEDVMLSIVPGRVLAEIGKMLPDGDGLATFVMNGSHLMCETDRFCVYTTLLSGEFIDYARILPSEWKTEISIGREAFGAAIDRCSVAARESRNNLIYLHLTPDGMEMTADAESVSARENIDIGFAGEELTIAFNSRYLNDVVHYAGGDTLVMCFNSNVSPCMIKPPEGNEYLCLVLPVRVFNNK